MQSLRVVLLRLLVVPGLLLFWNSSIVCGSDDAMNSVTATTSKTCDASTIASTIASTSTSTHRKHIDDPTAAAEDESQERQSKRTSHSPSNSDIDKNIDDNCVDDDEDVCQERNESECDSDPAFMLVHCRKKCLICVSDSSFQQDAGFGKTPLHISIQILQIVRQTNLYHRQYPYQYYSELYSYDNHDDTSKRQWP